MNPVNTRLGRKRGDYTAKAHRKHVRQVANQLVREGEGWKRDLAQSCLDVMESEDAPNSHNR